MEYPIPVAYKDVRLDCGYRIDFLVADRLILELKVVEEVKSGAFYERWTAERDAGYETFEKLRELAGQANPFTPIELRIREAFRAAHERE